MPTESGTNPSWGLVLIRITCGGILMTAGWMKFNAGVGDALVVSTHDAFMQAPGFIRWWGENVVLPHPWLFGNLIAAGELVGGLALFLGMFTRPAGFVLAFMFANFYFVGPETARMFALLLGVCCLALGMSRAGLRAGMDTFLDERLPSWATWTRD